jgi:hypothetical protein
MAFSFRVSSVDPWSPVSFGRVMDRTEETVNNFGVNLTGHRGVLKGTTFYKYTVVAGVIKPCPERERVFILESGEGLEPKGNRRNIDGYFECDGFKGTIDSDSLESVLTPAGKRLKPKNTGEFVPETVLAPEPTPSRAKHGKNRVAYVYKSEDEQ